MRRPFLKAFTVAVLLAAGVAQAATVTLTPGSSQTATLFDPAGSGRSVNLSLPGGGLTHQEFSNGTGTLGGVPAAADELYGAVALFNLFNSKITSTGNTIVNTKAIQDSNGNLSRVFVAVDANIASVTLDTVSGVIQTIGSGSTITFVTTRSAGFSTGATMTIKNLKVDLTKKTVTGDVTAVTNAVGTRPSVTYNYTNQAIWTFDSVTGPVVVPIAPLVNGSTAQIQAMGYEVLPNGRGGVDYSGTIKLSSLRLTTAGLNMFTKGFASLAVGVAAMNSVNSEIDGWGSMVITNRLATSLPLCTN